MAANCNYKVQLIGALDMLKFKNMPKVREAAIQAAPSTPLPKTCLLYTSPSPRDS